MSLDMCGQTNYSTVSTTSTILRHPNYPYDYLPDTDCTYTFRKNPVTFSAPIYFLVLKFWTSNYEILGSYPDCNQDYLEISTGTTNEKSFRFCGKDTPFPIYSTDVIRFRIFGHPDSEGGSFTAKVNVRSADLGTSCLNHIPNGNTGVVTSSRYPRGYGNNTCEIRLHVGSGKVMDLYFVDVNLIHDADKSDCDDYTDPQDFIEIRGASKVSTTFLEATRIKTRQCGSSSEITRFVGLRYDYIHIRFASSHNTYNAVGDTSSRGINIGYAIYESKVEDKPEELSTNTILWIGIVTGVLLIIIIIWVILYKTLNSKKKKKKSRVRPVNTPDALLTTTDTVQLSQHHAPPSAPPMLEPDYNPADLFAAKQVVDLDSDTPNGGYLTGNIFPNTKQDFGLSGLAPGYTPTRYENTAGQIA